MLIDTLPPGVTYNPIESLIPLKIDEAYDPRAHTYTWTIGTITPQDANCVALTVTVNEAAEPGGELINVADLFSGNDLIARAIEQTPVCCHGIDPGIIFVDEYAKGFDSGVDWQNAYSGPDGLQQALARATAANCADFYTIYVAAGSYTPGTMSGDTFALPEGTAVYGGFPAGGSDFTGRNPDRYRTILTGNYYPLDPNATQNDIVVTMLADPLANIESILDGFIVTEAAEDGITGSGVDFTVVNCEINANGREGLFAAAGDVTVRWCVVANNGRHGISHQGENNLIFVRNCYIHQNQQDGLRSIESTPILKNSVIFENALSEEGLQGVTIFNPSQSPLIYNNTIIFNRNNGISFADDKEFTGDPNSKDYPDIQNCILWYNGSDEHGKGGVQVTGFEVDDYVWYSCVQDANDVNFNISVEPGFAYLTDPNNLPDPNNPWHLAWDSPCIDAGNPNHDSSDITLYDLDGEDRIWNGRVDIGADEVATCDGLLSEDNIWNDLDFNADGILSYHEFTKWYRSWLSHDPFDPFVIADPNLADPNDLARWCDKCNLVDTGTSEYLVDMPDLMAFVTDGHWLWTACWKQVQMDRFENTVSMAMAGGGSQSMLLSMLMALDARLVSSAEKTSPEPDISTMTTKEFVNLVMNIYFIQEIFDESLRQDSIEASEYNKTQEVLNVFLMELSETRK